jgi:hypothetical protein
MQGQNVAEIARFDDPGDARVTAHQAKFDAATTAPLRFGGQHGKRAATHETEAIDVDDEWPGLAGDRGRLTDQPLPDVLVGGVDLTTRADYYYRSVALSGCA